MDQVKMRVLALPKKKKDTPRKTQLFRKIATQPGGSRKRTQCNNLQSLPEDREINVVRKVQPTPAKQGACDSRAVDSGESSSVNLVIDTSYSSDHEDSSVFCSSSSLPSPELFRKEHFVEQCTFRLDDELIDLHLSVKNSTLLERSHAENILTYHPPNLSTIIDAPTILAENGSPDVEQDLKINKTPSDARTLIPAPSADKASETPPVHRKTVVPLKKRVWFRSPLFSVKGRKGSNATADKKIQCRKIISKQLQAPPSSLLKNTEAETSQTDENDDLDGGTFFDFAHDFEHERYCEEMRERCTILLNAPPFPVAAVR